MITTLKPPTKRERALNYFIETLGAKREDFLNNIFFTYQSNTFPCVALFSDRGLKPTHHFRFKNDSEVLSFIAERKENIQRNFDYEQKRMSQYTEEKKLFQAGKILISSWGCEQTNIDFYLILERKNDFVIIQEIGEKRVFDSLGDRGTTTPDESNKIGEPFRKKISKFASIEIASYKYCSLWDGSPKYWSSYA